jgi:CDP-glucose 4,6-dehydratase
MGGYDPYSASKGCAELATSAYGRSFFNKGDAVVGSARAGNVIGGGDWARDRLMTDIVAAVSRGSRPVLRNPGAIRPWQHVLEPLSGYLLAAEYLWNNRPVAVQSWNFGPDPDGEVCVGDLASQVCNLWGNGIEPEIVADARNLHEAHWLRLDSSKARQQLGWKPRLPLPAALSLTVGWYKAMLDNEDLQRTTIRQIVAYEQG